MKNELPKEEAIVYEGIWRELQEGFASLSKNSEIIIADGSDHCIMEEKPEYLINVLEDLMR